MTTELKIWALTSTSIFKVRFHSKKLFMYEIRPVL